MKKAFILAAALAGLGTLGCTSTGGDKKYTFDQPPPLEGARPAAVNPGVTTTLPATKLPPSTVGVRAEDINDDNVIDQVRKLEGGIRADQRALTQAK